MDEEKTLGGSVPDDEEEFEYVKRGPLFIVVRLLVILFAALIMFTGLVIISYPSISNFVNEKNSSRVVSAYTGEVAKLSEKDYSGFLMAARDYNARLADISGGVVRDVFIAAGAAEEDRSDEYWSLLKLDNTSIMGYVVIELLDIRIPLYHGTSASVLAKGAGHLQGTSLPVIGESVHTVVSAHTGLPSARFFDKIDQLKIGDTFALHVMNEVMTFQVDQVLVVLPDEVEELKIQKGHNYATLVTCTPYGINSHRLLVRGTLIDTPEKPPEETVTAPVEVEVVEKGLAEKAWDGAVEIMAGIVESAANGIVKLAQWGMDIFDVEY